MAPWRRKAWRVGSASPCPSRVIREQVGAGRSRLVAFAPFSEYVEVQMHPSAIG